MMMLLAVGLTARAFDFSATAPTGQVLYYAVTGATSAKLVQGDTKPYGRLTIPTEANGYTVTGIDSYAFSDCPRLSSVAIPGSVAEIGSRSFAGCSSLTSVFIAEGLQRIGMMAFSSCTSLDTLELPTTINTLGAGFIGNTAIINNADNWSASVLYVGRYVAACRVSASGSIAVADSTLGIAANAFDGCHIAHLTLPASLRFIGSTAFNLCADLDTVRLLATAPPTLSDNPFATANSALTVRVPCSCEAAYLAAPYWSQMNIEHDTCQQGHEGIRQAERRAISVEACSDGIMVRNATGSIVVSDLMGRIAATATCSPQSTVIPLPSRGFYIVSGTGIEPKKVYLR